MNPLITFPRLVPFDPTFIDKIVRNFAVNAEVILESIKLSLNTLVTIISTFLHTLPWPLFLLAIIYLGYRTKKNLLTGVFYGALLFFVGAMGLWELMLVTLAVVIASVAIALFFGIPLGILLSSSDRVLKFTRPILDTMQTMPVFVYLIPALLLFGTGNASGVIATVIYAIVPVIRLTSLGLRQVDKDVLEAAKAFGSTPWQILKKVQIPQAKPTIMTGVNQTIMMAMSMVVTTSMIGVRGLGMEVLNAVNRIEIGRGLVAGSCVVVLAVVLDRITQGLAQKKEKNPLNPLTSEKVGGEDYGK